MWQVARESTIQTFTRLLELGEIMWFTTTLIHSVSELLLSLRLTSTLSASCLLLVAYWLVLNLVLTRLLQCCLVWPNFPQWWHWQTDRLDSKCKPQSSSEIGSSLNHRQIIENLMDFMCSCKDTTFFSRKEERIRLISSLLAHVLFWNWFVSFSHTVAETSGSPTKYNKDAGWTDSTIIASVRSLRGRKFAYLPLSRAGAASVHVPSTIFHNFSFIRAIWHCIFHVGKFFPFRGTKAVFNSNVIFVSLNTRARQHSLNRLSIQRDKQLRQRTGNVLGPEPDGIQAKNKTNAVEKKALATS